jgi:hypothetical protein
MKWIATAVMFFCLWLGVSAQDVQKLESAQQGLALHRLVKNLARQASYPGWDLHMNLLEARNRR